MVNVKMINWEHNSMSSLLYISNQELHLLQNQKSQTIDCHAVSQYKKNLQEIKQRKQWKTTKNYICRAFAGWLCHLYQIIARPAATRSIGAEKQ